MAAAGMETTACLQALSAPLHATPLHQLCVLLVTWSVTMVMIWTGAGVVITVCLQEIPVLQYAMICNPLNALLLRLHVTWATMVTAGTVTTACQQILSAPQHSMILLPLSVVPLMSDVTMASLEAAGMETTVCPVACYTPEPSMCVATDMVCDMGMDSNGCWMGDYCMPAGSECPTSFT